MTSGAGAPATADIGVIGGSGLYELFDDADSRTVTTPYGAPSGAVTLGRVGGRSVAFLPRHGPGHEFSPDRINYRANLWALHALGVRQVLAPCAAGSLDGRLGPGSIVVPDQVVDRTSGRSSTYHEHGAVHVSFADPYCATISEHVATTAVAVGNPVRTGATMVVVQGPRFSSRAESQWYAAMGWTLVNMTGLPEAALARELALCYATIALVTDVDAGVDAAEAVTQSAVLDTFARNVVRLRELVLATISRLDDGAECPCPAGLDRRATVGDHYDPRPSALPTTGVS